MAVSKQLRFEVFKRDEFRCVYCGRTPPGIILHVDHVLAAANGGEDDAHNLVTSCQECNLGKGARSLADGSLPAIADALDRERIRLEDEIEKHEQLLAYNNHVRMLRAERDGVVGELVAYWQDRFAESGYPPTKMIEAVIFPALKSFVPEQLKDAIDITARALPGVRNETASLKYFCGIIRNWRETGYTNA